MTPEQLQLSYDPRGAGSPAAGDREGSWEEAGFLRTTEPWNPSALRDINLHISCSTT